MKEKYIIEEHVGKFTVKKLVKRTKGILWWKREVEDYEDIDDEGNALYVFATGFTFSSNIHKMLKPFDSLSEAKKFIVLLEKGRIIHEI